MRVATNTFSDSVVGQLRLLSTRQNKLQTQASSGQRIQSADEDPALARQVLDLQQESSRTEQFAKNISYQQQIASVSLNGIKGLKKVSDRAGEIATLADGTKSKEQLKTYALEIDQLIKQGLSWANSKYNGSALFGGTASDQDPFISSTDLEGKITGVKYQGNTGLTETFVSENTKISAQTLGANSQPTGPSGLITDSRSGADFFQHLISLRNRLNSGNITAIAEQSRPELARDEENFISHIGGNAALQSGLEASAALAFARTEHAGTTLSKAMGADLAETLVRLNETTNAYQAALQTGGSLLKLSLLDYIH